MRVVSLPIKRKSSCEINLINLGELNNDNIPNYGWPIASYGVPYEKNEMKDYKFPVLLKSHENNNFEEPVFSFLPSIAISRIIKIPDNFSEIWKDNFLVATLNAKSIFRIKLDKSCKKDTILATNTSSISITDIASATSRPEKVIGMHFMNPAPMMKLVEVVLGHLTNEETIRKVVILAEVMGKTAVKCNDYPGFVSNRILAPMINEAIFCLMEGVAEKEAIDMVMKLGMAHPMGPLSLADLIGLDVCLSILEVLQRDLGDDKYCPCPLLREMVAAGCLGKKTGKGFYEYN